LPEYKSNYASLEFRIINPNTVQIYATPFTENLESN